MNRNRRMQGVSLIEALLALVVMAMGMLAVAGVQATLRGNADLSRQRAEALRLAQEGIEQVRAFEALQGGIKNYAAIVSSGPTDVTPAGSNTSFKRTVVVTDEPLSAGMKSLAVTVEWTDRAGSLPKPMVQLFTTVAKVSPEIAASLSVPSEGKPSRQPQKRHVAIPPGAVTQADGTSTYTPPQVGNGPSTTVTFNNASGFITRMCVGDVCETGTWLPLSGYVRSVLGDPQTLGLSEVNNPTSAATAFFPANPALPFSVEVQNLGDSSPIAGSRCFMQTPTGPENALEFLCAVYVLPANVPGGLTWSGKLRFKPDTLVATDAASNNAAQLRLCRYKSAHSANGEFKDINQPLALQNHLAIKAGSGAGAPYKCPEPTVLHQPL